MNNTVYIILVICIPSITPKYPSKITPISKSALVSALRLFNDSDSVIKSTNGRIAHIAYIKKKVRSAPFEAGFVACVIQEKFRRMVDKYNVSHYMKTRLYVMELIMYLEEIEHHYWEIDHLYGMIHEIERKYGVQEREVINDYVETTSEGWQSTTVRRKSTSYRPPKPKKTKKRDKIYIYEKLLGMHRPKKSTRWWWPLDYGWEIEYYW